MFPNWYNSLSHNYIDCNRYMCGDLDDDIGDGLTGGSNMEEVEASRESSGSVGGAGGRDLRLERGMLG